MNREKCDKFEYREGGWGWVVVLACGFSFGVLIGMVNNYALIYNGLEATYNSTANHVVYTAWIGSLSIGVQYIFCFVGGILIEIFSIRKVGVAGALISTIALFSTAFVTKLQLYLLTYGLLFGLGQALLLSATEAILPHYFKKRLSLANGLMIFVSALVIVSLPIFTSIILHTYALRETFFFLSGLNSLAVVAAATFKSQLPKSQVRASVVQKIKESLGDATLFKNKKYICWLVATFIAMFGYLIPIVNIDHHSLKVFPDHKPFYNNIIFGVAGAFGGLLFGKLGDLTKFTKLLYHSAALFVYGIVQLTIPLASGPLVFMIQFAILGLIDGMYLAYIVPIAYDLAHKSPKRTNQAIGVYYIVCVIPCILGPAIAGKIYEHFLSYNAAFVFGGVASVTGALIEALSFIFFDLICSTKSTKITE